MTGCFESHIYLFEIKAACFISRPFLFDITCMKIAVMKFTQFIVKMVSSQSGISSKRICGMIGWLCAAVWISVCTFSRMEIPDIAETFIICTVIMLGVDTIPKSIDSYRRKGNGGKHADMGNDNIQ